MESVFIEKKLIACLRISFDMQGMRKQIARPSRLPLSSHVIGKLNVTKYLQFNTENMFTMRWGGEGGTHSKIGDTEVVN